MKLVNDIEVEKRPCGLLFWFSAVVLSISLIAGCSGSGSSSGSNPPPNTQVVLLLTSTANDQLAEFLMTLATISLTDSKGNVVTLYTNSNMSAFEEWMHLNGDSEPFVTAAVPHGTYTSATVTTFGCQFTNFTFANNTLNEATYDEGLCAQGTGTTTVTLPNPIVVTGSAMALSLNLQIPQSYTLDASTMPFATYTISPQFTLSPVAISATPTDQTNGKLINVAAQVMSLGTDGKSFAAQTTNNALLNVTSNASTFFQGISGISSLAVDELLYFDVAIQSDGSLLATRIEVEDPVSSAALIGPYEFPPNPPNQFLVFFLQNNGCIAPGPCFNVFQYTGTTPFNVSGEFSNVANLPFPATFAPATFVQGQNISASTSAVFNTQTQSFPANAIVLQPQTLNGIVSSVSNQNGFAVYTVTLAPYDIFPILQNYHGIQSVPLNNPTTITVYADTSTSFLNSGTVALGSLIRFRGLVFDDAGTLRMDAATIEDGVTE